MYVAITASAAAVSTRHQRSKVKALGLALGNKVNKGSGAWEAAIVLSILGYGSTHTHTHTHTLDRESSHKQAATTAQPHFHPQGEVVRKMSSCEMKWNKKAQTQTWWWDYIQEFLIFNNVLSLRNINEVRKDKKKTRGLRPSSVYHQCQSPERQKLYLLILTSAFNNNKKCWVFQTVWQ